jgi:predicted RNA binding protein YcfA (HicA-like mRNA interferase family)
MRVASLAEYIKVRERATDWKLVSVKPHGAFMGQFLMAIITWDPRNEAPARRAARALGGMSWRQLRAALRQLGAAPVRARGSHEVWRFPEGETFVAVINHGGTPAPVGIFVKFRRLPQRRCQQADDEPAFGRSGSWPPSLRGLITLVPSQSAST